MAASDRPTAKQLRYLRALAEQTGTTFATPTTRRQASEAIDGCAAARPRPRSSRRVSDRRAVSDDLARARTRPARCADEISGYGSHAHWR